VAGLWRVDSPRNAVSWPLRSLPGGAPGSASGLGTASALNFQGAGTSLGSGQAVGLSTLNHDGIGTAIGTSSAFGFLSSGTRNYRPTWKALRRGVVQWPNFRAPFTSTGGTGATSGSATPTGVGKSLNAQDGTSAGIATVDGITLGTTTYQWNWKVADSVSQVYFWSSRAPVTSSFGVCFSVGTATAFSNSQSDFFGTALGSVSVLGVGVASATAAAGTAIGTSTVASTNPTLLFSGVGVSDGTCAVFSTDTTYDGFAAGTSTVLGVGARRGRQHGRWTDEPPDVQTWTTQPKDQ